MANLSFLNESESLWKARHTYRQRRLNTWSKRLSSRYDKWRADVKTKPKDDPGRVKSYRAYQDADDAVDKWEGLRDQASTNLKKRRGEIRKKRGQASEHFDVSEFDCHNGTQVPLTAYGGVRNTCRQVLEPMRAKFGEATVISGYRPPAYNRMVGGATMSWHIYTLHPDSCAADVTFRKGSPAQWAAYARSLRRGGVGQYNRSGFVHVDTGPVRYWYG